MSSSFEHLNSGFTRQKEEGSSPSQEPFRSETPVPRDPLNYAQRDSEEQNEMSQRELEKQSKQTLEQDSAIALSNVKVDVKADLKGTKKVEVKETKESNEKKKEGEGESKPISDQNKLKPNFFPEERMGEIHIPKIIIHRDIRSGRRIQMPEVIIPQFKAKRKAKSSSAGPKASYAASPVPESPPQHLNEDSTSGLEFAQREGSPFSKV